MGEIVATDEKMFSHRVNEISIYDLVRKGILDEIQEKLHKVTGMAFVTVDYRGEPVNKMSGFTEFCSCRRKYSCYEKSCCLSDAFGGATAAISNEPYVYKCPSGLVDIAIPIIIDHQYMGAMLGGQVRCEETEGLDDFGKRFSDGLDWKKDKEMCEKFEKVPIMPLSRVKEIAELAFLYVRQMCEKESALLEKKGYERKRVHLMAESKRVKEKEKRMEEMVLAQKKDQMNPHFMLNILNVVSSLACIEDAEQTGRMVELFIRMIKYQMKPDDVLVSLAEELDNVECYLEIQKLRFEDKMNYEIIKGEDLEEQMILPKTLLPFVENAVSHGILARRGKGNIRLLCYVEQGDCMITVEDEGSGFTVQQLNKVYEPFQGHYENSRVGSDIYMTRQRLMKKYGPQYDIKLSPNGDEGTRILVRIPQSAERVRYYV